MIKIKIIILLFREIIIKINMSTYFLIVTTLGSLFLFYLALAAFCNQEALKIKPENHVLVGFKLLLCSIVSNSI